MKLLSAINQHKDKALRTTERHRQLTYNSKYRRIAANDEWQPTKAGDSVCKSNRKLLVKILCTAL